jgi:hypothetical protein
VELDTKGSDVGSGDDEDDESSDNDESVELVDDSEIIALEKGKGKASVAQPRPAHGAQRKKKLQVTDEEALVSDPSSDESESGESA